ncbi:MAG: hypothetical protein ACKVK0_18270 [Pirellulales bacterium]
MMMTKEKMDFSPTKSKIVNSLTNRPLMWAVSLAVLVRLMPITAHSIFVGPGIPYELGGLFVRFAREISSHNYALPTSIPYYTLDGLPFAYPPVPFYLLAVVLDVLPIGEITAINVLPTLISIGAIGAFYLLLCQLPLSRYERAFAILAWAILPNAFAEQTQAAGIAESFGTLAMILLMAGSMYHLNQRTRRSAGVLGASWALAIVASPGSIIGSIVIVGIVFSGMLITAVSMKEAASRLLNIGVVVVSTAVLTSFYWVNVIVRHGLEAFTYPFSNEVGIADPVVLFEFMTETMFKAIFIQTGGVIVPFMAILGAVVLLRRNHWLLAVWLIGLIVIPREGVWLVAAPTAVLVGVGVRNHAFPVFQKLWTKNRLSKRASFFCRVAVIAVLMVPMFAPVRLVAKQVLYSRGDVFLSEKHLDTMEWVSQNVEPGSKFIVVGNTNVVEWFPHRAEQEVLNMPYGSEWEPREHDSMVRLVHASNYCESIQCIRESVTDVNQTRQVFLYIDKGSRLYEKAQTSDEILIVNSSAVGLVGQLIFGEGK